MKVFKCPVPTDDDVIFVDASIEGRYKFRLAVDTAATHTTIVSNVLYLSGYKLKEVKVKQNLRLLME